MQPVLTQIHVRRVIRYLSERAPLVALAAALGGISALASTPAQSPDEVGLERLLIEEGPYIIGQTAWEPSRGIVQDLILGRPLLFEAADPDDPLERHDIYRTFVRVSPEGKVLDVGFPSNLTGTSRGNETGLISRGALAAFATRGKDAPASVTFLRLSGEKIPEGVGILGRLQLGITRYLETGSWSGLGRSDLFVDGAAQIELSAHGVVVRTKSGERKWDASTLFVDQPAETEGRLVSRLRRPIPWLHWAANTGRHLVGTGPIAWAEGRAFSLLDRLQRSSYSAITSDDEPQLKPLPVRVKTSQSGEKRGIWPPETIVLPGSREGDGKWHPIENDVLPGDSPPLFYRTVIHPDPERPYAELHLVAMDMRRLELGIGAGYEDPHPDTGPPGSGQIPAEPEIFRNVVATFNGAFKAAHGAYGMKAEGRLLVEPIQGAATVAIDPSGSAGFGNWPEDLSPADVSAFRQNLDPLVADGKVNPSGRKIWGDHLYGEGVAVERSALCLHHSGQLLYGWALEATGESLAAGMAAAGCTYALHLDMNPGHCAFTFNQITSINPLRARGKVLDKRMKVNATRFVRWSPKDFFYLMRRAPTPNVGGIVWAPAPGKQPPPASMPGIFVGKKTIGGLAIEFDRVNAGRVTFALGEGTAENPKRTPDETEHVRGAIIAWGLGHRTRGSRPGMTIGMDVIAPLDRSHASLILEEGKPTLLPPAEPQTEREQTEIVQLPVLARGGKLAERALELGGTRRRAAMCFDSHGNLYVARMTHDTPAPLAQALVDVGCSLVVELDRGSHPPPLIERAETAQAPHMGYEQSTLYGIAAPLLPHTHEL